MKRLILIIATLSLCVCAKAQQDSIQLQEIVVEGARTISKADRTIVYPSAAILDASTSGYSLISRLMLPGIRVDEVGHAITSTINDGSVQLRINNIVVDKQEMLSLDMASVVSIEYIDNPGVRYGEGIAKVINIKTRRAISGYTLGADLGNAVTTWLGNNMVYGKVNHRDDEFSLSYNNSYCNSKNYSDSETANYLLTSGDIRTITRQGISQQQKTFGHQLQFTFNRNRDDRYQFQAKLSTDFANTPVSRSRKLITDGSDSYYADYDSRDRSAQPTLDLYYDLQIDTAQALRINAVGTYIKSSYNYAYNEGQSVDYACDGQTYSLTSEAIYENRLRPFTLTAGANYQYKYVDNEYTGSIATINQLRFSNLYGFVQVAGHVFKRLNYVAGIGLTYTRSHQDSYQYRFTLFRPKLTLQYPLGRGWKLKYSAEISQHVSQIANTSSVTVRTNSMEMEKGNPDLRPNSLIEQTLRLSIDRPRLSAMIDAFYRRNNNVNLDKYIRTDDNLFVHSQKNQEQCTMFLINAYANWFVVPEKFCVGATGGINRFINIGDEYRHHYTSGLIQTWANAYLGKFSLSAYADNGWHFMEGEREGHNGSQVSLSASYHTGDFSFSLTWQQPFESNHKSNYRYIRNRYVAKYYERHDGDMSNLFYIGITWNLSRGKQYKGVNKRLNNSDRQTGIMKM